MMFPPRHLPFYSSIPRRRPSGGGAAALLAVTASVLALAALPGCSPPPKRAAQQQQQHAPEPAPARPEPAPQPDCSGVQRAWANAQPRLAQANTRDVQAAHKAARAVGERITQHKSNARRFAQEMLSFDTTVDYAMSSQREFEQQVARTFRAIVLDPEALPGEFEPTLARYTQALRKSDNTLLRDLRVDVQDLPVLALPDDLGLDQAATTAGGVAGDVTDRVRHDFRVKVGTFVGGEIAFTIASRIATRMGVRVAAGAAGAALTLGASLLVSIGVDAIVSELDDTEGKLTREVEAIVDEIAHDVVAGDGGRPGVRQSLLDAAEHRHKARVQAVRGALHAPNDPQGICDL